MKEQFPKEHSAGQAGYYLLYVLGVLSIVMGFAQAGDEMKNVLIGGGISLFVTAIIVQLLTSIERNQRIQIYHMPDLPEDKEQEQSQKPTEPVKNPWTLG